MKTIAVTEFKAHCLEVIKEVSASGEPVLLTKRGKPTVMISVPPALTEHRWILGQGASRAKIVGDIMEPLDVVWESNL